MTLETFFEKFDLFADAPDAVAKMRELVLQLAVQGKLVESKEGDGNAAKIFTDGLPPEAASRFEIAESWIWIRFAAVGEQRLGKMLDQKGNRGELKPYLRNTNVQWMRFQLDDIKELRLESDELEEYRLLPGDLLICEGGEPGRCAIWRDSKREMYFQKAIHRVRPRKGILSEYLAICLQVDAQNGVLANHFTGATIKHFTGRSLSEYSIPLPPLTEQKRIVAKVDELMALCDRLEAQQQERETRHAALARASLARFADAPTPANINFLFHPSYAIPPADLRKSVLTLAVQGKLVPQDPNDEPASELLERLARELTPEQRRRQADALSPLPTESLQYELPDSWTWARFRDVAIIASNLVKPDDFLDFTHLAPDNIEKGNGVLLPRATVREDKVISSNHRFYPGQVVYSKIRPNLAKVVVVDFDGLCSADMYPIDALIDVFYLQRYMLSESFLVQAVKTDTRVAMPKINQMELNAIAVPIPPLDEQRRIVAKVEQLMALVDALETQLAASRATAANLLTALVAELTG